MNTFAKTTATPTTLGDDAIVAKRPAAHRPPPASQTKASDTHKRKQEAKVSGRVKSKASQKKRRRDSKKAPKVSA